MFKNYFKGIEGIADYPVISLVAFFIFFTAVMVWSMRVDKKVLNKMSEIPFGEATDLGKEPK